MHDKLPIIVYIVLALLLMLPLLGPGYYLTLDMTVGPNSYSDFKFGNFYGFGSNPYGAYLPVKLVFAALSQLISVEIIQKMLFLSILFLCGVSAHYSLPSNLGNSRYFAGLFYTLNPLVFIRFLAGHWAFLLSYSVWPLAIKYFLDFLKNPTNWNAFAAVALITAFAAVSSHGVFFLLIAYLFLFLFHIFKSEARISLVKRTIVLAIIVLTMNLFWIIPAILNFNEDRIPVSAEASLAEFGAKGTGTSLPFSVLTLHGFWRNGFTYTKDVFDLWYLPFIAIALLSIIGLIQLFKENRGYALSLLAVFIIGFLLSLGSESPISWVYKEFDDLIPISFIFRDSQKFVALMALVYSLSGAVGVHYLLQKFKGLKAGALLLVLLAIPVIYNYGFFGFLGQIGPTEYPEDWAEADLIIAADEVDGRILFLPPHLYNRYHWVNGQQKTLANPAGRFFSKSVMTAGSLETKHVQSDKEDTIGSYLGLIYKNAPDINNTAELLLPLNARYIILSKFDDEAPFYLWLFHRKGGVPNITLVYEGPTIFLFRNELVQGQFLASKQSGRGVFTELLESDSMGIYSSDVVYEKITPAYYRILSSPFPYVVTAGSPNKFVDFNGKPLFSWYGLGAGFQFTGPGVLENHLFYYVLGLLLLSWLIAIVLIIDASRLQVLLLLGFFIVIQLLIALGIFLPSSTGALIIITFGAAFSYKYLRG